MAAAEEQVLIFWEACLCGELCASMQSVSCLADLSLVLTTRLEILTKILANMSCRGIRVYCTGTYCSSATYMPRFIPVAQ